MLICHLAATCWLENVFLYVNKAVWLMVWEDFDVWGWANYEVQKIVIIYSIVLKARGQ